MSTQSRQESKALSESIFRDDPTLLAAFRAGEQDALERVYRVHVQRIEWYARALARSTSGDLAQASVVSDLVQEVFLRAFSVSSRRAYDGLRDYHPYLARIARNCFVDLARARGREVPTDLEDLTAGGWAMPPSEHQAEPKVSAVLTSYLAGLPVDLSRVYEQRFVLGLSQQRSSSALGLSRRELRTAEGRLRGGLRKALVRAGISLPRPRAYSRNAGDPCRPPDEWTWALANQRSLRFRAGRSKSAGAIP